MRRNGFTLIELVVVLALISVIAAIVLPRLDPFVPQRRLKSAARMLSGTISLAYAEAIAKNRTYRLHFELESDRYWITEVTEDEEDEEAASAIGIRLGTNFELLQYTDGAEDIEPELPSEPMLAPKELPPGVHFASVEIRRDLSTPALGPQYIEFNPLGDASPATINLKNESGDAFAIRYDGVTGIPTLAPLGDGTG